MSTRLRWLERFLVGASFLILAAIVWRTPGRWGDLSDWYTDQLRHPYAARVFMHRGPAIYWLRFDQVAAGVPYPHPVSAWGTVPYAYPPGALLLFLPLAWLGQWAPLSTAAFGKVCVLYLLALAHLALLAVGAVLRATPRPARIPVYALCWGLLVYAAAEGFYDPAWVGLGALAAAFLLRRRPHAALLALTGAGLLSYRAVVLAPLGVAAALQLIGAPGRVGRVRTGLVILAMAAAAAMSVATFLPLLRFADAFRFAPSLAARGLNADLLWTLGAGGLALGVCAAARAPWTALGVAGVTGLALVDVPQWWHSLVVLAPLISAGVPPAGRALRWQRWALLVWALVVADHAWRCSPVHFYQALAHSCVLCTPRT